MQLKHNAGAVGLRAGLVAASCALLAPVTKAQSADTQIDTGLLVYQEDHGRVRSIDAIVKLNQDFGEERILGATLAVDSLSGGSPNGAIAARVAQTFATPSGTAMLPGTPGYNAARFYTIAPGDQPLDPNFRDLRAAIDLNWSQPLGIGNKLSAGGHLSYEHDFVSLSGNAGFSHDFNSKNTTLGLSVSAEFDRLNPIGGVPVANTNYALLGKNGSTDNKSVLGAQLGITQVLTRNWIAQLNLSVDHASGYLNDPYKILSRVDGTGLVTGYQYESRPDSHTRRSVYLGNKVALGRTVLDLSLRYGTDDWGVKSRTAELHYRIPVTGSLYLEPQLRWYKQDAADFYRLYLTAADTTLSHMSADPRLGAFTAKTVGLKLGIPLDDGDEISLRLEGYEQNPKLRSSALAGLSGLDLNPKLRAVVLQLGWRFSY